MSDREIEVLVVGAGPTGLVLAIALAKLGVRVRVVDHAAEPGTTSRALAVQARTLELYRAIDLADEVRAAGLVVRAVNLWRAGERAARIDLSAIGAGQTPYPSAFIYPQDEHERLLTERLARLGVTVERPKTLRTFREEGDAIVAEIATESGATEAITARFLAGCDGARSTVRTHLEVGFPGGTYEHTFYVADVAARGPVVDDELHVMLDEAGFLGIFPQKARGHVRLVGTVPAGRSERLGWADVDRRPVERAGLDVTDVRWFSTYRVHHRVADTFRVGRAFLLGDAGHIHSPVGGQGMNTGIGDALNLGWKLAAVLGERARSDLLDTYEPERIGFARRLVRTTDRVFSAASNDGSIARLVRTEVAPRLLARVARLGLGRDFFFRTVSQTGIAYPDGAWSHGHAGAIRGGDRLPWWEGGDATAYDLSAFDWRALVFGAVPPDVATVCASRHVPVVPIAFDDAAGHAGYERGAVYLVRPDAHVGAAFAASEAEHGVRSYLERHAVVGRSF